MNQPVFAEGEFLFPLQEIKAVLACFPDQVSHFSWGKIAHFSKGMNLDPVQNFILDNIANSGKYGLVEENISDQLFGQGL